MNVGLNGDLLVETVGFVGVKIGVDLFRIIIIIILTVRSKL